MNRNEDKQARTGGSHQQLKELSDQYRTKVRYQKQQKVLRDNR